MKAAIAGVTVVLVLIVVVTVIRRSERREQLEQARLEDERAARQHVDLSALPEVPKADEEKPVQKFKRKPIVVEMKMKNKKGGAFRGKYQLVSANGDIVGQDDAPPPGEPAVFIVAPGIYELVVPGTKFRKKVTLVGDESGKMALDVVVASK